MSAFAQDISSTEFDQVVVDGSKHNLVLVDFWAPWCGPCRALTPVLERLAQAYQGKFVLAKVNSDENQELARQYAVRSIPNVKAFVDGKLVDEFLGALPESAVRAFIDRLLPTPAELLRREAAASVAAGDPQRALSLLSDASALEPHNDAVKADRVDILLDLGRADEARETAARLSPLAQKDARIAQSLARLQLANDSENADDLATLEARVRAHPEDLDSRLAAAKRYVSQQQFEPALEHLLEITRRDRTFGDDSGRKTMLAVFDLLGGDHEIVNRYRRLLSAALH